MTLSDKCTHQIIFLYFKYEISFDGRFLWINDKKYEIYILTNGIMLVDFWNCMRFGIYPYNSSNFVASIIAACTSIAAQQLELLNDLQWQDSYVISL